MPSAEQLRSRLLKKLSELFQLDQPDLDFGFYRIMHAKAQEVQDFIGTDLLKIVADAFGDVDEVRKAELKEKVNKEIAAAKEYGVADPENSPKVKEAEAAYEAIKDTASAEADVYDHLYRSLSATTTTATLSPVAITPGKHPARPRLLPCRTTARK